MPHHTDITGLLGIASAIVIIGLRFPGTASLARNQRFALLVGLFVLVLVPFAALPLAAYVRGATGDLSVTTLVLLWLSLFHRFPPLKMNPWPDFGKMKAGMDAEVQGPISSQQSSSQDVSWWRRMSGRNALLALVSLAALVLYPLALGAGMIDPYRIGYGHPLFVLTLLLIALLAWFNRLNLITLCIALALLAWAVGWYESNNLWDYLLDPFVSFYALWVVFKQWLFKARPAK